MYEQALDKLKIFNQEHILDFFYDLSSVEQESLLEQIDDIDFNLLEDLIYEFILKPCDPVFPEKIEPVFCYPIIPDSEELELLYKQADTAGRNLISESRVAVLTVAGGQGTRLGFDAPKGAYPITPIMRKSLFQYFAESIIRASEKFNCKIMWYIMTSGVNDHQTKEFFAHNNFFGMEQDNIRFFVQGVMPVIGFDGKILMRDKAHILFSPDGHGGTLKALKESKFLQEMKDLNIEYISYFQVDNPLVSVLNPTFIGLHYLKKSQLSSRVLKKTDPYEKLGVFCDIDGVCKVIEYLDLPDNVAEEKNSDGSLRFDSGSPAIHIFSREFIEKITDGKKIQLPWHKALKQQNYIDQSGEYVISENNNAIKFETFIFDTLPLAEKILLYEALREDEFAPVKNNSGDDSPETCRAALINRDCKRLSAAGVKIPFLKREQSRLSVELSPRSFLDEEDVVNKFTLGEKPVIQPNKDIYIQ